MLCWSAVKRQLHRGVLFLFSASLIGIGVVCATTYSVNSVKSMENNSNT